MPFVVEMRPIVPPGDQPGPLGKQYVETEERAKEIVAAYPTLRSYRPIAYEDMPAQARDAMLEKVRRDSWR